MKKYFLILLINICIILIHCGGSHILIKPEYQNKKFPNARLFITGHFSEDCVLDEETFKDIGFDLSKLEYCGILKNELTQALETQSNFQQIESFYDQKAQSEFKPQSLLLNKDENVIIHLPEHSIETNLPGDIFLLAFENIEMKFIKKAFESSHPAKYYNASGGNSPNDLKVHNIRYFDYIVSLKSDFAVFHNNSSKVVSFGKVKYKAKFVLPNTVEDTIEEAAQNVIEDLLAYTPFQNKK